MSGRPLWRGTQVSVEAWRQLGSSEFLCRAVQFGIFDPPQVQFIPGEGEVMGDIPQSKEDLEFGLADLKDGCATGIYQEVTRDYAMNAMNRGAIISSAFTVWQETDQGVKGRFIVNLSKQSKHWRKGSVQMEMLSEFAMSIQPGDHFLSFDIYKGYRAFRLAPGMRDWFLFRYGGRYFKCVALPFGWGRSPLWFTQLVAPLVKHMRGKGWRILAYIDDFLIIPTRFGKVSQERDCAKACRLIDKLLRRLGLKRHPSKGCWGPGSPTIEHLGVHIDSTTMKFTVLPRKLEKVRRLAKKLLQEVRFGKRWVTRKSVAHFSGVCVSLTLAMPWARFYTRSLYWDMSSRRERDQRGRIRLSHQSVRDLRKWKKLSNQELAGRPMVPPSPSAAIHTDAADVGYGGTLNTTDLRPGVDGQWHAQGIWSWKDRAQSITLRELKAVRLMLTGSLGKRIVAEQHRDLLLHVDNQAVVHITNAFVSSSRPMMRELRKLKSVLDHHGLRIRAEWIPSVANKFADGLSRRFSRGDLQIKRRLRHSVVAGMKAPIDSFRYRPVGEHPVFLRRQAFRELDSEWDLGEVRLLCPPVDLIGATVRKLRNTQAPAILLIPDWPRQGWHREAIQLASRWNRLPHPAQEAWAGHRRINPKWSLLMLEVNLGSRDVRGKGLPWRTQHSLALDPFRRHPAY